VNILFDNVDWNSTAGPHWFGRKLANHLHKNGHNINGTSLAEYQAQLSIVIASQRHHGLPLIQRLDGIYYDTLKNYVELNAPIKATYDIADGVVFQSGWSKMLVESQFGPAKNSTIIHNGADVDTIQNTDPATGLEIRFGRVLLVGSTRMALRDISRDLAKTFDTFRNIRERMIFFVSLEM